MARKYKYKYKSKNSYKWYKRYKTISYNYFKVKAEFIDKIYYPDNGGHAIFNSRRNEQVAQNQFLLTNSQSFQGYTYINTLAGIFSYYKLLGVRVEVTPDARNQSLPANSVQPNLYLSYRAGVNNGQTIGEIKANNQTLIMNPVQKQVKYFRVYNESGKYSPSVDPIAGAFTLLGDTQGDGYDTCPSYTVKLIYYLLYKYSKA